MSALSTDSDTRPAGDPDRPAPGPRRRGVVLPQAAQRLDTRRELWPDEVRVRVETLNLDAASFRQLETAHSVDGGPDGDAVRREVLEIVAARGKMQNPVTGSGGMLVGTVEEVGPESTLGLAVGDRVATLVSLTLTPLVIEDGLERWDGLGEQVPGRRLRDPLRPLDRGHDPRRPPADPEPGGDGRLRRPGPDPPGRGAATSRPARRRDEVSVAVIGGAGKSGSLSLAAARDAGATRTVGVVPHEAEAALLRDSGLADHVVVADARDPIALRDAVAATGGPADVTVVCVDVPGCEGGAILTTADGGTVIFFSMATSFSGAALGAEGLAADVTMLVGNGYTPGHAAYALELLRAHEGVRSLFERRL